MKLNNLAKEIFKILRSFDYEIVMYDDDSKQIYDPTEARRFFAKSENLLITITDQDEDSSVNLYLSKTADIRALQILITSLRTAAVKFAMLFQCKKEDNVISPKNFTRISVIEQKDLPMNFTKGMYGTSRTSYLKLNNAKMIVRHASPIQEGLSDARARKIDSIEIEHQGKRHRFPTNQIAPARAMAHHLDNGGAWSDSVARTITTLADEYTAMGQASNVIRIRSLDEGVRNRIKENVHFYQNVFANLSNSNTYKAMCEQLTRVKRLVAENASHHLSSKIRAALDPSTVRKIATVFENENKMRMPQERSLTFISVFGKKVNKDAWEKFKRGELSLRGSVDISDNPKVNSEEKALAFAMGSVADLCTDESMSNLIGSVAGRILSAKNEKKAFSDRVMKDKETDPNLGSPEVEYTKMVRFGQIVLRAAGVKLNFAPQTGVVREHLSWIKTFEGFDPDDQNNKLYDDAMEEVVSNFDYERFKAYYDNFRDMAITKDSLVRNIASYIEYLMDKNYDLAGANAYYDAVSLYPDIAKQIENDPDVVNSEEEILDESDLTQEDVLLPKSQGDSLANEIEPATVIDPETGEEKEPDDPYLARMISLAGVQTNKNHRY